MKPRNEEQKLRAPEKHVLKELGRDELAQVQGGHHRDNHSRRGGPRCNHHFERCV